MALEGELSSRVPVRRLLAESVVVIFSILAAFAIDAWWDGRQAKDLERELLLSLQQGFEENGRLAQAVIGEARRQQALIGRFIAMSPDEAGRLGSDSTYALLRALWRPNYVQASPDGPFIGGGLNSTALIATLDAGQLSLISDVRLIDALANWQGVAEELGRRSEEVVDAEQEVLEALARYPELQSVLAGFDDEGELAAYIEPPRVPGAVARRARQDTDLMAHAARKGFLSRAEQDFLEHISLRTEAVLALIRANLER